MSQILAKSPYTAFNNDQTLTTYLGKKKSETTNVFKRKNQGLIHVQYEKYVTQQQTTTTDIPDPDIGQAHTYKMWRCLTC